MKKSNLLAFFLAIASADSLRLAHAETVVALVPAQQIDRTLYVAKARLAMSRSSDYGKMVEVAAYNQSYAKNPNADALEVLKDINRARAEYDQRYAAAAGRGGALKNEIEIANSVIDSLAFLDRSKAIVPAIKSGLQLGTLAYDYAFGPDAQVAAQISLHSARQRAYNSLTDELQHAWDFARFNPNPSANRVLDHVLADSTQVSVNDHAAQILASDSSLADLPGLALQPQDFDRNGNLAVRTDRIEEGLNATNRALRSATDEAYRDIHQATTEQKHVLNGIESWVDSQNREKAAALADATRLQTRRLAIEGARNSVYILSVMGGAISPRTGQQISVLGGAAIQTVDSIQTFADTAGKLHGFTAAMNGAVLTGNVLGAAMQLMSLFGGSGPDPTALILNEIAKVREDIVKTREELREHFALVNGKLNLIMDSLDRNFAWINASQREILTRSAAIQSAIVELQTGVHELDDKVSRGFDQMAQMSLDDTRITCQDLVRRHPGARIKYSDFRRCLDKATDFSTTTAKRLSLIQTPRFGLDTNWTETLMSHLEGKPIEGQIDFLVRAARDHYANSQVPGDILAEPVAWSTGANLYVSILNSWPKFSKLVSSDALQEMEAVGHQINDNIAGIAHPDFLDQLLNQYQVAVVDLRKAVLQLKADTEAKSLAGYDLFSGQVQATRPFEIPAALTYEITNFSRQVLTTPGMKTPPNLARFIAGEFFKAAQIGLGELVYSWKATQFALLPMTDTRPDTHQNIRVQLKGATPENVLTALDLSWDSGLDKMEGFLGSPVTSGTASQPAADLDAVRKNIARRFETVRNDLGRFLSRELRKNTDGQAEGSLGYYSRRLDAAKLALQAYLSLGMSKSLNDRPLLSAGLLGDHGLLDSAGFSAAVLDPEFLSAWLANTDVMSTRIEMIKGTVHEVLKTPGRSAEPHPLIETIRSQLETLKQERDARLPAHTPRQALDSLLKAIDTRFRG